MANTAPELDVLAVGAHPDDVEIACGGTLAKLVRQGHRVGIVDLTDGEPTPRSPGPDVRLAEAHAAARALGIEHRVTLDLPNRRLFDTFEARVLVANEIRRHRPKLVIGLEGKTPQASPDHWQAMQITDAAVFYARLTKWDHEFSGLPPHSVSWQLYATLARPDQWLPNQPAGIIVDISDTLEQKVAAVRCYETQFPPEKAHVFEQITTGARFLGLMAGIDAGELLLATRPRATRDLMRDLVGDA
jgi:bacillithiol biosynthesis deacetylase BshB1